MKKLVYLAFAILAVSLTACKSDGPDVNDPKEYCWEINATAIIPNVGQRTITTYAWADGQTILTEIEWIKKDLGQFPGVELKIDYKKSTIATEEACDDAADEAEENAGMWM
jgi:hypothetical protein